MGTDRVTREADGMVSCGLILSCRPHSKSVDNSCASQFGKIEQWKREIADIHFMTSGDRTGGLTKMKAL